MFSLENWKIHWENWTRTRTGAVYRSPTWVPPQMHLSRKLVQEQSQDTSLRALVGDAVQVSRLESLPLHQMPTPSWGPLHDWSSLLLSLTSSPELLLLAGFSSDWKSHYSMNWGKHCIKSFIWFLGLSACRWILCVQGYLIFAKNVCPQHPFHRVSAGDCSAK